MKSKTPKIALYYDWLNQWGGAERLLLDLLRLFPQADLFTSLYHPRLCPWLPPQTQVFSTPFSHFPPALSRLPLIYPLLPPFLESFDFSAYDIVVSLTSQNGHCLITPPHCLFVCYCLTPNRYLYQPRANPLLSHYRPIDQIFSRRPDHYWAISPTVQSRISQTYNRPSTLLAPGVDTDFFTPGQSPTKADFFLIVSRLVEHKNIDTAIRAARQAEVKLKIVGTGRRLSHLKQLAVGYCGIEFIGSVTDSQLRSYYRRALALICPQVEDFGLSPLESLACGTPVIALNQGGIPDNLTPQTGIVYEANNPLVLAKVLAKFSSSNFTSQNCRRQALNYSRSLFMLNFKNQLLKLWRQHQHDY